MVIKNDQWGERSCYKNFYRKATEVTEGLAPGITETVLLKMLNEGKFDDLIFDGIEKVAYRGIEFSGGDMLEDNTEERAR